MRRHPFAFLCLSAPDCKIRGILCGTQVSVPLALLRLSASDCKIRGILCGTQVSASLSFLCLSATYLKLGNILCRTHLSVRLEFLQLYIPNNKVPDYPNTASGTTPVSIQIAFLRPGTSDRASQSPEAAQMPVLKEVPVPHCSKLIKSLSFNTL